jgi:hypothetical protein
MPGFEGWLGIGRANAIRPPRPVRSLRPIRLEAIPGQMDNKERHVSGG